MHSHPPEARTHLPASQFLRQTYELGCRVAAAYSAVRKQDCLAAHHLQLLEAAYRAACAAAADTEAAAAAAVGASGGDGGGCGCERRQMGEPAEERGRNGDGKRVGGGADSSSPAISGSGSNAPHDDAQSAASAAAVRASPGPEGGALLGGGRQRAAGAREEEQELADADSRGGGGEANGPALTQPQPQPQRQAEAPAPAPAQQAVAMSWWGRRAARSSRVQALAARLEALVLGLVRETVAASPHGAFVFVSEEPAGDAAAAAAAAGYQLSLASLVAICCAVKRHWPGTMPARLRKRLHALLHFATANKRLQRQAVLHQQQTVADLASALAKAEAAAVADASRGLQGLSAGLVDAMAAWAVGATAAPAVDTTLCHEARCLRTRAALLLQGMVTDWAAAELDRDVRAVALGAAAGREAEPAPRLGSGGWEQLDLKEGGLEEFAGLERDFADVLLDNIEAAGVEEPPPPASLDEERAQLARILRQFRGEAQTETEAAAGVAYARPAE
ncbi:hypothetical protein HXX76_012274 [Chlamydomonas incerta]|uniref:Uncharacterized protein n=1 Tax=Chlamydomonas incerta TaxID=51695 RepID=A0A835SQ09_CHLIN|nr:hypothetical protein HXX76_012274 [Chlamydomonas incerta]|eukprot:KAG2427623.1 hypothetical protein HXX76_012274 [Chlamydomonas incerta]